mgnify:CR=1 FL=1
MIAPAEQLEPAALRADAPVARDHSRTPQHFELSRSVTISAVDPPNTNRASEEARSESLSAPSSSQVGMPLPRPRVRKAQAVNDVPQPQLDFALGLTNGDPRSVPG